MTFLQQLEQLLHGHAGIWGTTQGEDLPQQNTERPPETQTHRFPRCRFPQSSEPSSEKLARYSHVALVRVDAIKERLRSHPLHWQTPLEGKKSRFKVTARWKIKISVRVIPLRQNQNVIYWLVQNKHLRLWSSCNSRYGGCPSPGQSRRSSSRCPPSPKRYEQPDLCGCTEPTRGRVTNVQRPASHVTRAGRRGHLFGGQILHSSSHLEGTGHQVLDGHVLHWDLVWVVAVLHARRASCSEVFPQVSLRRILNYDVKWTWRQKTT